MKKWIWIPVVLGLAVAARMISQGTDASVIAKARKELTSGCLRQGLSVKAMTGSQVEQFCACSVDRTIKLLGATGTKYGMYLYTYYSSANNASAILPASIALAMSPEY